jgi:Lon protease-like protein
MHGILLPLFPLELVLFPRTPLPLHIFEDRYKLMIGDAIRNNSEFGIVQAGEKGIVSTGCTATVERVMKEYPDGRMDILALGRRRFEIVSLDEEKEYLRGSVEFFDDEESAPAPHELRIKALERFEELKDFEQAQVLGEPAVADPQLSFQLAQLVPDLEFRQLLLATRSETDRLKQLTEFIPGYVAKQKKIAYVKSVAHKNGHTKPGVD